MPDKIDLNQLSDKELSELSGRMLLSLNLQEMKTVQDYFRKLGRNPSLMEIEIIAQTWSEHCVHKTMTGIIEYEEIDEKGNTSAKETIRNLLKETIFRVTRELDKKYCLSVFKDNAGVIELDRDDAIAMKVETHNHPSAIEPYGGAATGIGGVIRDVLGCGRGAKPVLNIDVFCFGPVDYPMDRLPRGILHPKRIFKGVVKGVRDYGNRMGIPTSSGAIIFSGKYIFNPLVYCGTVGVMPRKFVDKKVSTGELIVAIGGRTGRDGIHGATFSSISLNEETDVACVQIGDPITEKKFTDVLVKIRDRELFTAITDCGAGGFSSAIGEMGKDCGARVDLEKAPLKYKNISPWEIFLSESQERMVLSVPRENLEELTGLLESEDVEWAVLGEFTDTGRLEVFYNGGREADLDMDFIHNRFPVMKKKAVWRKPGETPVSLESVSIPGILRKMLAHPSVACKETVTRQYDHEVQGGSVIKPLSGVSQDAPQDGCVTRPVLGKKSGIAVGLGINYMYGLKDAYFMALANCEEAARNLVACGGRIDRAAFMDNFCWGDTDEERILGDLVRASRGCYDAGRMLGVPFCSGKDSLNNCYTLKEGDRTRKINIPGTLLITCVAPVDDVSRAPGSDFKEEGNFIYAVGDTYDETGCSLFSATAGLEGGVLPRLREGVSVKTLLAVQEAVSRGLFRSCHDMSEGGLALALAEMCFSGIGADVNLEGIRLDTGGTANSGAGTDAVLMFSESNSRFLAEVAPGSRKKAEKVFGGIPFYRIGKTTAAAVLKIRGTTGKTILEEDVAGLKKIWKAPVKW
ncbi:MAG: phosphoribosylformylglycinamidine synthase subunit PurL [Elusimicrobia bacterium]|nr:phosphoribosylformylglycinamidine synthase subunit PurL [Elusimicrobiota bacterium]